ncbi:type II toxin-antitoxin system HicB family antitoxin [Roseospira navarrensis]|uniref:HicB family protein n=1 Tax=Roseospira navarrensis TaxID=140058 RepID=A0A7X2D1I3_9PROT|nr:type II toxin-antitoxin system HicB family antitoxin [Roseospira navarrensis]MQX35169.1 HicB family protein [Roseospira navarrensis]
MRRTYPAVLDRDGSLYGITFPDVPGCISAGDTVEAAGAGGTEALTGHIACMVEDGDALPDPTPLEYDTWKPDKSVVCVTLVSVPVPGRVQRYNVTLDESLVAEIDQMAGRGNRSRFLAEAAR